jgi:tRNA A-37 threonylcarbamoyl transferase component Bud32
MKKTGRWPCHFNGDRLYIEPGWEEKLAAFGLVAGGGWDRLNPGVHLIDSGSKHVNMYRVALEGGETVYFKCYRYPGKEGRYFMQRSRAGNEVYSYRQFAGMGVTTVMPLALGEIRKFGTLPAACVVTREIPDAISLDEFARLYWCNMPADGKSRAYREISSEIIRQLQLAHRHNFFHYDLKWRNILVYRDTDGRHRTAWIDCPRGRYMRLRRGRGRMVDLSSLARLALSYLSRTQRLRFIHAYLGERTTRRRARRLFMKVDRHLSRRMPEVFDPLIGRTDE